MRAIFGLVFIIGVALAGAAVYLAKGYLGQQEEAAAFQAEVLARTGGLVEIIVAATPKNYGDTLAKEDVTAILWPQNALPEGAFLQYDALFPQDDTAPRFITRRIEAFEPILAVKVTEPGQQAGLNGALEPGMRAFAINVAVSDLLQVGDHVDLYWTGSANGNSGEVTRLIETRLKIIAIDRQSNQGLSDGTISTRSLTVAVTPEQVGRLAQAQATGRLVTSLVGLQDTTGAGAVEIDSNKLLGISAPQAQPVADAAPAPQICTIRTRRGGDVVDIPIPCSN
jgi:pilus assembly protein CpaB